LGALAIVIANASAQLRIVTWNVTNYGTSSTSRNPDFQTAIYGVVPTGLPLAGRSMSPDVFVGQEFTSATSVTNFLSLLNTAPGSPGDWAAAPFVNGNDTDSALFYRTSKAVLVGGAGVVVAVGGGDTCNQPRNTMRYDIRPVGYTSAGATVGIYSVHLKAQGSDAACPAGENSFGRRLLECQRIRDNAEGLDTNGPGTGLPAGYHFIVAGDFNIQTSSAADWQELVGSQPNNAGRCFDPINAPGSWNNNATYRWVHTQDPATQVDDRFDIILTSIGLLDGPGFNYIGDPLLNYNTLAASRSTWNIPEHSYRCWGQDGGSYNAVLRTTGNTMVGPVIAQALINTASGNGHLPVYADFRVPAKASSPASINFGQVQLGAAATQSLVVTNAGDTVKWTTSGIASLNYTLAASSGFTAPPGSFIESPGGGGNSHTITMNTSTLGLKSGTITIASDDPDQPVRVVSVTGEVVLPPNVPPIANAGPDQNLSDSDLGGTEPVTLDGSASNDPDGTIVQYRWSEGPTTLVTSASPISVVTLGLGTHTIQLEVTDDRGGVSTDTLVVTVTQPPNLPPIADAGADQTVTDADNSGSESVTLNGSGSSDPDGTIVDYQWVDGSTILAQGPNPSPSVMLGVGTHTITLHVTDNRGGTATDFVVVTVEAGTTGCVADVDDGSGTGTPDGGVTIDDLLYYLVIFEAGSLDSDVDDGSFTGTPDGGVTIDDLLYFLFRFEGGC
jgi:hypothetical protein